MLIISKGSQRSKVFPFRHLVAQGLVILFTFKYVSREISGFSFVPGSLETKFEYSKRSIYKYCSPLHVN